MFLYLVNVHKQDVMRGQHNMKAPYVVNTDRRVGLGNILLQHVAVLISVDIVQIIITGTTDLSAHNNSHNKLL